jgi:CBS domain-containing protein
MTTAQDLIRTDYVSVDINDTISQMLGKLKRAKQHSALVFDGKKYMGVIGRRYLLTSRINPAEMKVKNIIKKRSKAKIPFYVPELRPDTDIKEICRLMSTADTHVLPVLEKDRVLGIVSSHDVAKEIAQEYRSLASQELASIPITAKSNDEIYKAINIFSRQGIDHLPIVDEQNRLIGMVAMSDLLENPNFWGMSAQKIPQAASHQKGKRTGYAHGEKTKMTSLPIENCMSRKSMCCTSPDTRIPEAVRIMDENKVCNIVLIKNNQPVGILTIKDLLVDYAK